MTSSLDMIPSATTASVTWEEMATNNQQRSELVAVLWELKQNLSKSDQPLRYVHFNMLLSDEDYRNEVISKSEVSDVQAIRTLAERARRLNMGGKLLATSSIKGGPPNEQSGQGNVEQYSGTGNVSPLTGGGPIAATGVTMGEWHQHTMVEPVESGRSSMLWLWGLFLLVMASVAGGAYLFLTGQLSALMAGDVHVKGSIITNTLWTADRTYILDEVIYVEGRAQLTIEPGTTILGAPGSALVVTRDATLYARGTAEAPIVFTSAQPVGQRQRGDWGGVVLLGNAPVNVNGAMIEGIDAQSVGGALGLFGGADQFSNCGLLEYVRIEFAGFEAFANNELNGLTLGGCGRNTVIRHVQVHKALDDGIEMFGGNVNLKNIVVTGAADDSFDWDMGWSGFVQFLVIQQHPDAGDNGFEADNNEDDHNAQPRSEPIFYNVTMVGSRSPERAQRAMTLRRGTAGHFRNFIIMGFPLEAIDIRDEAALALIDNGELDFRGMILHNIGPNGNDYFTDEEGDKNDDGGFDEARYFNDALRPPEQRFGLRLGIDPQLPIAAFDTTDPNFVPAVSSPAVNGAFPIEQGEFWDEAATYLGAIRPGATRNWLDGWTAFPQN